MMIELIIIIVISLAFGSFANNVISYYINSSKFDFVHSTCFCGKKILKWYELIPVLSYFLQKGKCTECQNKISFRYPLVEMISVAITLIIYSINRVNLTSVLTFFILYILLIISVIDFYKLIIPNFLTIILLILSITYLLVNSFQIFERVIFSSALSVILISICYFYEKYKGKVVLGIGDIKLIFVLTLLLNIISSMIALWISSLAALIVVALLNVSDLSKLKSLKIPFGLYLSIGFTFIYLWNLKSDSPELESILLSLW